MSQHPLLAYAQSYEIMSRDKKGSGVVAAADVAYDIRHNMVPVTQAIAPPVAAGSVDTEELRKLALAATPGDQWRMNNDGGQFGLRVNSGYQGFFNHQRPNQKCTDEVFANVAYILAAKPSVVLSLIERAEKAEADAKFKQAIIDRLMLEYCPAEMTAKQMAEYEKHQVRIK